MNRKFTVQLFRPDGSPVTKKQVENLKPGDRLDYLIESPLPIYGYFSQGKSLKNLFINPKKQLSGFLLVGVPAPNSKNITVCEFDGGLINSFEVALTHFNKKTHLVVYPAWQANFSGHHQKIKIGGVKFENLVYSLKDAIFRNISRIPAEPWDIKFRPYEEVPPSGMKDSEIFIQKFRPHKGFGTGITKKGTKVMLDWKMIDDIFSIKEGMTFPANLIRLETPTKWGIQNTVKLLEKQRVFKGVEGNHQNNLGKIFNLSKIKGKLASLGY